MSRYLKTLLISAAIILAGCAHDIQVSPRMEHIANPPTAVTSELNVGYYISPEDHSKKVTTPGGGGDKITYFPYKDSEAALNAVLSKVYKKVYSVPSLSDRDFLAKKQISFIFKPQITTSSSSGSAFTWPPTNFSFTLSCAAVEADGREVWRDQVTGQGQAKFDEFKSDFALAARRAIEDAFNQLLQKISANPAILRKEESAGL